MRKSAWSNDRLRVMIPGTATHCNPAFFAPITPFGESSTANAWYAITQRLSKHARYEAGLGLTLPTSSEHTTVSEAPLELTHVSVQAFRGHVVVGSHVAAFEHAPERL